MEEGVNMDKVPKRCKSCKIKFTRRGGILQKIIKRLCVDAEKCEKTISKTPCLLERWEYHNPRIIVFYINFKSENPKTWLCKTWMVPWWKLYYTEEFVLFSGILNCTIPGIVLSEIILSTVPRICIDFNFWVFIPTW